jgi:hypothetical protein
MNASRRKHMFRCMGRSDRNEVHVVVVEGVEPTCSCQGVHWCSHIDATLVCGERFMVPAEDRHIADAAQRAVRGHVGPPTDWQASWKEDRVWRGLSAPRSDERMRMRLDGRPTICFVGAGSAGTKPDYEEGAETLGWKCVDRPNPYTTMVVCSAAGEATRSGVDAIVLELPMITHDQWDEWQYDVTNAVLDEIERLAAEDGASEKKRKRLL